MARTGFATEVHHARSAARQMQVGGYCHVDGCYRETRGQTYCEKHYMNLLRTGHIRPQKNKFDYVSDAAGPECGVCGRSVYEHGVTEFCQEVERKRTA